MFSCMPGVSSIESENREESCFQLKLLPRGSILLLGSFGNMDWLQNATADMLLHIPMFQFFMWTLIGI